MRRGATSLSCSLVGAVPRLAVVAHLSRASVVLAEPYQRWMAGLGPRVRHLMASLDTDSCTLRRATKLQVREGHAHHAPWLSVRCCRGCMANTPWRGRSPNGRSRLAALA